MIAIYILLVLMIIGAMIALEVKDLISAVVAVGIVGLALSLLCLILKAPDVAITQFIVEIIALIILIRATLKQDLPISVSNHRVFTGLAALLFMAAILFVALTGALNDLPAFGHPEMRVSQSYLDAGATETGATNVVAGVLLDYRAYDTLGEATVLFAAVIGVMAVVRRVGRKQADAIPGQDNE